MNYSVSGECISSIFHRLSQNLGDFEGLLFGTLSSSESSKLLDDGSFEIQSFMRIQNVIILKTSKILNNLQEVQEAAETLPKGTAIVGWITARKEAPVIPSFGDISTLQILSMYKESLQLDPNSLIFASFTSNPPQIPIRLEIENGQNPNCLSFEYKFFHPSNNFSSIRVEIENLKETNTKYNSEKFYNTLESDSSSLIQTHYAMIPKILIQESENLLNEFKNLLPKARALQIDLERAESENLRLKLELSFN
jgi:hypothetical protein